MPDETIIIERNGNLSGTITPRNVIGGRLTTSSTLTGTPIPSGGGGTTNYEVLRNKPQINGVELIGNKNAVDLRLVSENTTAGWNANPQYLPKPGEICIYTDAVIVTDDLGNTITYPDIKIGDGNTYLIDKPFVTAGVRYTVLNALWEHEKNHVIHITQEEREFWNNKLNTEVSGEELILNRN